MRRSFFAVGLLLFFVSLSAAQPSQRKTSVSVLDLGATPFAKLTTDSLRTGFRMSSQVSVSDPEMAGAAARGVGYTGSLNLSLTEARDLGTAMASDFYIIGDAQTLRRSSSQNPVYYESYCSILIVSSRSGRLVLWERPSYQSDKATSAQEQLSQYLAKDGVGRCLKAILEADEVERKQRATVIETGPLIEEAPDDEKSAEVQGIRLPRPYRRLRPEYPESAALAEAEATVDVAVDIGVDGEVGQVQVVRWGGFGLDETTVATVRRMHFFPAMKNGSPIPMRVLLRYNFRKPPR